MITFDLSLGHWMIRGSPSMSHSLFFQIVFQFSGKVARTVVAEQSGSMSNLNMVHSSILNRLIECVFYIQCGHGSGQFPCDDVSGKIIQNR